MTCLFSTQIPSHICGPPYFSEDIYLPILYIFKKISQFKVGSGSNADGQRPQVEGRDRTIRGVAFAVPFELLPGKAVQTVQVHHAAPDREIAPADDIGALQGKDQQHFSSPDADAVQGGESSDDFSVGERRQFSDIE